MHVVFGAGGALGASIVQNLAQQNKPVRAVVRDVGRARKVPPSSAEIVVADASKPDSIKPAFQNASVIYHCVNVPYDKWTEVMPLVTDNILAGAIESQANVVFPGNDYVYGPFQKIPTPEDHPLAATTKKGRLRIALEKKLIDAHNNGKLKTVIPRFPDYYGPNVTNNLMKPIFLAAISGEKASWIGNLDVQHSFVFNEDAAAACIMLAETASAYGEVWHVPGAGPITGREFIDMAFKAAGKKPDIGLLSENAIRAAGQMNPEVRELIELMYKFEEPLVLDGSKFSTEFPSFKYTSHEEGIRKTIHWFRQALC
jgi:nucleoside-diphosphate-sugar epimerase